MYESSLGLFDINHLVYLVMARVVRGGSGLMFTYEYSILI